MHKYFVIKSLCLVWRTRVVSVLVQLKYSITYILVIPIITFSSHSFQNCIHVTAKLFSFIYNSNKTFKMSKTEIIILSCLYQRSTYPSQNPKLILEVLWVSSTSVSLIFIFSPFLVLSLCFLNSSQLCPSVSFSTPYCY